MTEPTQPTTPSMLGISHADDLKPGEVVWLRNMPDGGGVVGSADDMLRALPGTVVHNLPSGGVITVVRVPLPGLVPAGTTADRIAAIEREQTVVREAAKQLAATEAERAAQVAALTRRSMKFGGVLTGICEIGFSAYEHVPRYSEGLESGAETSAHIITDGTIGVGVGAASIWAGVKTGVALGAVIGNVPGAIIGGCVGMLVGVGGVYVGKAAKDGIFSHIFVSPEPLTIKDVPEENLFFGADFYHAK